MKCHLWEKKKNLCFSLSCVLFENGYGKCHLFLLFSSKANNTQQNNQLTPQIRVLILWWTVWLSILATLSQHIIHSNSCRNQHFLYNNSVSSSQFSSHLHHTHHKNNHGWLVIHAFWLKEVQCNQLFSHSLVQDSSTPLQNAV